MRPEWHSFLQQAGAQIVDARVADFGDAQREGAEVEHNLLADLSHHGLLAVRGDDAAEFLQGQLTNDVRLIDQDHHHLTGYCTPKGRLLGLFRIFQHRDGYLLQMPLELVAPVLKRLRMFVLRSKVVLHDESEQWVRFGLAGPDATGLLEEVLGTAPAEVNASLHQNGMTVLRIPGVTPRYEICGEFLHLQSLWQQLFSRARPVGASVWSLLAIRAGMPQVFPATGEAFVPQMINLHAIDGVSFRKGCYTGQEVVARMQYLGKLKRRMYRAHLESETRPLPGDELFAEQTESGQGTGKVVDAQPAPGGGYELLAVISIAAVESGRPIHLHNGHGPVLHLLDLPYAVDEFKAAQGGQ